MPGGAGLAEASAHKGFFGQLSAVGYTTRQSQRGAASSWAWRCFPSGRAKSKPNVQMFPLRRAATLRPAPPQEPKPGPVAPGSFSTRGWGQERGCWWHHNGVVEPAPSSAPCLAPQFSGTGPWEAAGPWGGAGGPPAGGRWCEYGQHCGGDRTAWARGDKMRDYKEKPSKPNPFSRGWEADMQSPAADPARLARRVWRCRSSR